MSFRRLNNRIKSHTQQMALQRRAASQLIAAMTTTSQSEWNMRTLYAAMAAALGTGFVAQRVHQNKTLRQLSHTALTWAVFSLGSSLPSSVNIAAQRWLVRRS